MPDSHRFGALRTLASRVVVALSLWWAVIPAGAQDSCRLSSAQKIKAVKAFKALSPIFQDPRCVNCHGAVNPFIVDGGHPYYINIVEEAKKYETSAAGDPALSREQQWINEIAQSQVEITDTDLIRIKAEVPMQNKCRECHVIEWDPMPMRENHFAGRSWKQICMHMKTSSLTDTPVEFLSHMQDDTQVKLGFRGLRGIKPGGQVDVPRAEPPAMPFDTMAKHANDWIDAMNANFHPPAECGCEVDGLALEIRHHIRTNPESGSAKAGRAQFDGTVVFDVLLEEVAPGWYRNDDVVVRRTVEVKHTKPSAWLCSGTGWRDERWMVTAQLDEPGQSMQVRFGYVDEGEEASWTCTFKGNEVKDQVNIDVHGDLKTLTMPTVEGAVGRAIGMWPAGQSDLRYVKELESITISLIDLSPRRP